MVFNTEPTGYEKTILSELQGAWSVFRETVVKYPDFPEFSRLLFHIDEATSWESVRDFNRMKSTLLIIKNIVMQSSVNKEITFWLSEVNGIFEDAEKASV